MTVSLREDAAAWDAYAQSAKLAAAGLDRAAGFLAEYERNQTTLREALDRGIITEAEFGAEVERTSTRLATQMDELQRRGEQTGDVSRQLGLTFSSAFEDAIVKGEKFGNVLKGVAADLARLVLRRGVTQPLLNAASPVIDSIGSGIAGFFGFGGARATGGPVSAGMTYLVGERGPELFVPGSSGNIVPNHAMGGPTFNVSIDARNSTPDAVARLEQRLPGIIRAVVEDASRRGGGFGRALRSA